MKKLIIGILATCLLIGIPFIMMDFLAKENGNFHIPYGYERIKVDLSEKSRNNEIVYTKELKNATVVSFMVQSDSNMISSIKITSSKKLIGSNTKEEVYEIRNIIGNSYMSPKFTLQPGTYTISVTNVRTDGTIMIGYKEKELKQEEYERLLKIDSGDLNHPPKGYELVYSADLSGLDYDQEVIKTITLDHSQLAGISVYTNASQGNVSVDFIGDKNNFTGLVTPSTHYICDRQESTFSKGDYQIQLTSKNADGQIYIFIKK